MPGELAAWDEDDRLEGAVDRSGDGRETVGKEAVGESESGLEDIEDTGACAVDRMVVTTPDAVEIRVNI